MPRAAALCTAAGNWTVLPHAAAPLPEAEACPEILSRYSWMGSAQERSVECCAGAGRRQAIGRRRFEPCDGRAVPLRDVLGALRGRTVAFVGDSTLHRLWTALVHQLYTGGEHGPIDVVQRVLEFDIRPQNLNRDAMCTVSHATVPRIGGSTNRFRFDARRPLPCNLTGYSGGAGAKGYGLEATCHTLPDLELHLPQPKARFLFYRVDANRSKAVRAAWQKTRGHCGAPRLNFDAKLEAAIKEADVVLANIGVWYADGEGSEASRKRGMRDGRQAYRSDVRYMLQQLAAMPPSKLGLWRETNPQHFHTRSGSGLFEEKLPEGRAAGASCPKACADLGSGYAHAPDWRNRVVHDLLHETGFGEAGVLPTASLLRPLAALHKPTSRACMLDCTHYCFHPALWAALLDGLYRRILNWAASLPGAKEAAPSSARFGRRGGGGRGGGGGGGGRGKGQRGGRGASHDTRPLALIDKAWWWTNEWEQSSCLGSGCRD